VRIQTKNLKQYIYLIIKLKYTYQRKVSVQQKPTKETKTNVENITKIKYLIYFLRYDIHKI
jgi:hypothetical protein